MNGINTALPDPSTLIIPANFEMIHLIDQAQILLVENFDISHRQMLVEIYRTFQPTQPERSLASSLTLQLAKVHSARENTRVRLISLKTAFETKTIPKGIHTKLSGSKNTERIAEITLASNLQMICIEVETQLAIFNRLNNRFAELYSDFLEKLVCINNAIAIDRSYLESHLFSDCSINDSPPPFNVANFAQIDTPLIRKLLSTHCILNPRIESILKQFNSHLSTFMLARMDQKSKSAAVAKKKLDKQTQSQAATSSKAAKLFSAANAITTDQKLDALLSHISAKNSNGGPNRKLSPPEKKTPKPKAPVPKPVQKPKKPEKPKPNNPKHQDRRPKKDAKKQ